MQVSMNTNSQNPNFGYFEKPFDKNITEYLQKTLTKKTDVDKFAQIVEAENKNSNVSVKLKRTNERLYAYLRSFNSDGSIRYAKDIEQGFFSRLFENTLAFIDNVHRESAKISEMDSIAQKVITTVEENAK